MAHYVATVRSPWSAERAFTYLADLRNFEEWDPGVHSSVMARGSEPGPEAAYDVKVTGSLLRYKTRDFAPPRRVAVEAVTRRLRSYDVIEIEPRDGGCVVTYDATLELRGPIAILSPFLGLMFRRIGDRAAEGLERALEGTRVTG